MKELADLLHKKIIENFVLQGHSLTGSLENSLSYTIEQGQGSSTITFYGKQYAKYLENGVSAAKIPYNPDVRTGAKHSKYIQALIGYVLLRMGKSGNEGKKIAFAIARKHKKEGMPTQGSYKYSRTGKRLHFITEALQSDEVYDILSRQIGFTINNKINEFNDSKQTNTEISFSGQSR